MRPYDLRNRETGNTRNREHKTEDTRRTVVHEQWGALPCALRMTQLLRGRTQCAPTIDMPPCGRRA
jgi:hypothetical protein